jgi:hypothetical protein
MLSTFINSRRSGDVSHSNGAGYKSPQEDSQTTTLIWWCIWQNFLNSQKGYIWWCHHPKYSINAKYTTIVIWIYDAFVYAFVSHFWCLLTLIVAEETIRRFVRCRMLIFSNVNPVVQLKKLTTDGYICWCQKQNFLKNRWWIYMLGDIYAGALLYGERDLKTTKTI